MSRRMSFGTGFSLVEIMVAMAIIGILAGVAIPMYSDYVTKSKIPEATSTLAAMRVKAEQYFADNRTYADTAANWTARCTSWSAGAQHFTYSCGTPTASAYTFTATGSASDLQGFSYTINQDNARTTNIASPAPAGWQTGGAVNCWITSKGQTC